MFFAHIFIKRKYRQGMRQSGWKWILAVLFIVIGMCVAGYLLLVMAYSISTERMKEEMGESVRIFVAETNAYTPVSKHLDSFTDSLMLLTASHPNGENAWKDAVRVPLFTAEGMEPIQILIRIFSGQDIEMYEGSYGRYWHGYLIFLKPLLVVFSYPQIRDILSMVQIGLFTLITMLLTQKRKYSYIICVFLFWMIMNPIAGMLSLQYSSLLNLTFVALIGILLMDSIWKERMDRWLLFFLVIGGLTSYFDLLTFPVVPLGVPLTLWIALGDSEQRCRARNLVGCSIFWALGYGGMWVEKWILGTWIIKENFFKDAMSSIRLRTASFNNDVSFTWKDVLEKQIQNFKNPPVDLLIYFILTILMIMILAKKIKINGKLTIIYSMIALYPFLWYGLIKNHSFIHSWFTYRDLSVTFFAVSMFLVVSLENGKANCK